MNTKVKYEARIPIANDRNARATGKFRKIEVPYKYIPLSISPTFMDGEDVENFADGWADAGLRLRYETKLGTKIPTKRKKITRGRNTINLSIDAPGNEKIVKNSGDEQKSPQETELCAEVLKNNLQVSANHSTFQPAVSEDPSKASSSARLKTLWPRKPTRWPCKSNPLSRDKSSDKPTFRTTSRQTSSLRSNHSSSTSSSQPSMLSEHNKRSPNIL